MLEVAREHGFKFDTAQMPLNVMDAHFRSFAKLVVPELVKEKIGVLGMKPMANGIILKSKTVTPIECLHYALNLPTSVVITGIDSMKILDQAFEAARIVPPSQRTRNCPSSSPRPKKRPRTATSSRSRSARSSTAPLKTRTGSARSPNGCEASCSNNAPRWPESNGGATPHRQHRNSIDNIDRFAREEIYSTRYSDRASSPDVAKEDS